MVQRMHGWGPPLSPLMSVTVSTWVFLVTEGGGHPGHTDILQVWSRHPPGWAPPPRPHAPKSGHLLWKGSPNSARWDFKVPVRAHVQDFSTNGPFQTSLRERDLRPSERPEVLTAVLQAAPGGWHCTAVYPTPHPHKGGEVIPLAEEH